MGRRAFSLIELAVAAGVAAVLSALLAGAGWNAYKSASLAVSASNIRQLNAGAAGYLADNNYVFWKYRGSDPSRPNAIVWWFGLEPEESRGRPEGKRLLKPEKGPLGGYIPAAVRPDPSFRFTGRAFKPKFQFGYIGVGYNVLLGGGWLGQAPLRRFWDLPRPGEIVVFATSAQVNSFQPPASPRNPLVEEFYGLDGTEISVHFRHGDSALVGLADGSCGFLAMDPSTLDPRAPQAHIGRFAPRGSTKFLLPAPNP